MLDSPVCWSGASTGSLSRLPVGSRYSTTRKRFTWRDGSTSRPSEPLPGCGTKVGSSHCFLPAPAPGPVTRRPEEPSKQTLGLPESIFEYMVLCNIDGCVMPVSKSSDLGHETPRLDRVVCTFGKVTATQDWIAEAANRYSELDPRHSSARAIMADIEALKAND